jgi:phage shock protein A
MTDLFKKLNTLIQAGINDVMAEAQKTVSEPLKHIPRSRLGKGITNEVDHLRQKVNDALAYEDELVARLEDIQQDMDALDRQADAAVAAGDDAKARYLLERLNRAQQRYTMTESDLKAHRIAAQDLIRRVNELDAAIADAEHAQANQPPTDQTPLAPAADDAPSEEETTIPVRVQHDEPDTQQTETAQQALDRLQQMNQQTGKAIADVLREAREKVDQMNDLIHAKDETQAAANQSVADEVQDTLQKQAIDDDIAARRARLAGPPKQRPSSTDSS